jgi:hypothetical protein
VAYIPVIRVERAGAQTGAAQKAFENNIPCFAKLSIFGVVAVLSP